MCFSKWNLPASFYCSTDDDALVVMNGLESESYITSHCIHSLPPHTSHLTPSLITPIHSLCKSFTTLTLSSSVNTRVASVINICCNLSFLKCFMFAKAELKTTQGVRVSQVVGNVQVIMCDECESGKGVGSGLD